MRSPCPCGGGLRKSNAPCEPDCRLCVGWYAGTMDRSAVVYSVNERFVVASSPRTNAGIRLHVNPVALPIDAAPELIAQQLQLALQQSESTVPHLAQSEWKGSFDPFLRAAGVRSFRAFMASASLVEVDQNANRVTVTPTRNMGPKKGFESMESEAEAYVGNMDDLAAAVLRKLG